MEIQKFYSLLAALIGLIGSFFLSKGVVVLSPKIMLHLTSPYSKIAYAPEQITSMAAQKADATIGVIYIVLAFLIQVISLTFIQENLSLFKTRWLGFWVAVSIASLLTVILSVTNITLRDRYRLKIGKLAVYDYCAERIKGIVDPGNVTSLESMANELLDYKRRESEQLEEFARRICKHVNYNIPEGADFTKLKKEKR